MKKILLLSIVILTFCLRLYRINYPLADWHSWRQADTSAVSRNFVKYGFNLLYPKDDDLSDVASGRDNPEGLRLVEFPIYNLIQASAFKFFPIFNLEVWGRLISIVFSCLSAWLIYLIAKKYLNEKTALLAAFFYAVLPFNIFYGRVILPEPMMVAASLAMIYFAEQPLFFIFFAAIAFLLKPFTLIMTIPTAYLVWGKWRFNKSKWLSFLLFCSLALLPFVLWRTWISRYPEGIPQGGWLFNSDGIRLKGAWFYWLFAERLSRIILGYWGLVLLGLGLIVKVSKKEGLFFHSWLAAILIYLVMVATGNVKHDYYQVMAIPIICIFLAKGSYFLLTAPAQYFQKIICHLLFVICLLFTLAFSWYQVRDFFNINNSVMVEAGRAVDQLVPREAKVIAPYSGDTAFLYQTNRRGWPIGISIEKMIKMGAEYYVNFNFGPETDWLMATYCVIEKTSKWVIIDLAKKCEFKS